MNLFCVRKLCHKCVTNVSQMWDVLASLSTNMNIFLCAQILLQIRIFFVYATRISDITCVCKSCHKYEYIFVCEVVSQIWVHFWLCNSCLRYKECLQVASQICIYFVTVFYIQNNIQNIFCVRKLCYKYEVCLQVFEQIWVCFVCATRVIDIKCVCKSRHKYEDILCVQFVSQIWSVFVCVQVLSQIWVCLYAQVVLQIWRCCAIRVTNMTCVWKSFHKHEHIVCAQVESQIWRHCASHVTNMKCACKSCHKSKNLGERHKHENLSASPVTNMKWACKSCQKSKKSLCAQVVSQIETWRTGVDTQKKIAICHRYLSGEEECSNECCEANGWLYQGRLDWCRRSLFVAPSWHRTNFSLVAV